MRRETESARQGPLHGPYSGDGSQVGVRRRLRIHAPQLCLAVAGLILILCLAGQTAADSTDKTIDYVRVVAIAKDNLSVDVAVGVALDLKQFHLLVKDSVVKDRIARLHPGDLIKVVFSADNTLKAFAVETPSESEEPSQTVRIFVLLASSVVLLIVAVVLTGRKPLALILGADNRYSNSKFQMALWFWVVLSTYLAAVWLRACWTHCIFLAGVGMPQNLLLLSGMSALTFGGAVGITAQKAADAKQVGNNIKDPAAVAPSFFSNLIRNDYGEFDFGDFQMFVITLIAVATYLTLVFRFLGTIEMASQVSLPDVDTTILASFGLGQGAYLTKKAVGDVGKS
jgi:hypothetical protein